MNTYWPVNIVRYLDIFGNNPTPTEYQSLSSPDAVVKIPLFSLNRNVFIFVVIVTSSYRPVWAIVENNKFSNMDILYTAGKEILCWAMKPWSKNELGEYYMPLRSVKIHRFKVDGRTDVNTWKSHYIHFQILTSVQWIMVVVVRYA